MGVSEVWNEGRGGSGGLGGGYQALGIYHLNHQLTSASWEVYTPC